MGTDIWVAHLFYGNTVETDLDIYFGIRNVNKTGSSFFKLKYNMNMKTNTILRITGLLSATCPIVLKGSLVPDFLKGLMIGIGIGLLILSLIITVKEMTLK